MLSLVIFGMSSSMKQLRTDDFDPLDDYCTLDGHPDEPLTIESAKLCDPQLQPMFGNSWTCPEDPTCRACKQEYIDRFTEIQKAFREVSLA